MGYDSRTESFLVVWCSCVSCFLFFFGKATLGVGWLALIYKDELLQWFYGYCSSSVHITGFVSLTSIQGWMSIMISPYRRKHLDIDFRRVN